MKMIIAVTFFGILKFAFAEYPPDTTECLDFEDYENFNTAKFLKGIWYVTHARYGSNSTVCREYKTRLRKNGIINIVADGYYNFGGQPRYYRVRCEGTKEEENGKLSLNCKQQSRGKVNKIIFNYQLDLSVIETDYDKFAVIYTCAKFPASNELSVEDNILILHRDKDNDNSGVETILQQHESSLQEFLSRKDSTCLPSPVKN